MRHLLLTAGFTMLSYWSHGQPFDLIITHGRIIDGTGNNWFYGDIGIRNGKIGAIGHLDSTQASEVINAGGRVVSPGFIDVHTHIEDDEFVTPTADNFIHDGVTTVITGNCGGSNVDMDDYFHRLDSIRMSVNVASLIGHNSVRRAVMGDAQRDPTPQEQSDMEALVEKAMTAGAVGFSTGLIYVPGIYSRTPEVVGLARAAARYHGIYASHIRNEGDHVLDAINEAIDIAREANLPVEISHFKVTYKPNWGRSVETLALVEAARQSGVDVTIDQYPYIASSTTLDTTVPEWAFSGGRDSLLARLNDPAIRTTIIEQMVAALKKKKLKNYSYAMVARYPPDSTYNGLNISEINRLRGRKSKPVHEAETILEMITTGRVQMVYFSMAEEDLQRILRYPFNMTASDGGIIAFGKDIPHPRCYGTNCRVLGHYVRDLKILTLEEAVRRMTSLPAARFQLHDRGLLREGMMADVVVFDPDTISDAATFEKPHAYSLGIDYVIVNGQIVVNQGHHTGVRCGMVLKGPGFQAGY